MWLILNTTYVHIEHNLIFYHVKPSVKLAVIPIIQHLHTYLLYIMRTYVRTCMHAYLRTFMHASFGLYMYICIYVQMLIL